MSEAIEKPIQIAVTGGYDSFKNIDKNIVFLWLNKLSYGMLFKELSLDVNRRDITKGKIYSQELLEEYGIRNVTVCGDTRFDRVLDVRNQARDLPKVDRFVKQKEEEQPLTLIAGSSWPQDEDIFIPYFNTHPEMKLIIAPHEIHQEHLTYIESLLKRPSVRLSEVIQDENLLEGKDCLIVDSFGMLSSIYRYGTIAYIGGGFGAGIHNTLEAAVYGMPVLLGPRYQKFKEARDLIKVGGGFSVSSKEEFDAKMDELLTYSEVLKAVGQSAGEFVNDNVGATQQIMQKIGL